MIQTINKGQGSKFKVKEESIRIGQMRVIRKYFNKKNANRDKRLNFISE